MAPRPFPQWEAFPLLVRRVCLQGHQACRQDHRACRQDHRACRQDHRVCHQDPRACLQGHRACHQDRRVCLQDRRVCLQGLQACRGAHRVCRQALLGFLRDLLVYPQVPLAFLKRPRPTGCLRALDSQARAHTLHQASQDQHQALLHRALPLQHPPQPR